MPATSGEPVLGGFVVSRPAPIKVTPGQVIGFTFLSDLHIGATHVDYKLIEKELRTAGEKHDRILINGDVLDLILTKDFKRFQADVLHPRLHGKTNIVNAAIDWAVEILAPYVEQIDMIGLGNHETAVTRYGNFDPLQAIVYALQKRLPKRSKHVIHYGGYTGFVDYRFHRERMVGSGGGKRWVVYYHHGGGGAAPVTKGLIDFARRDVFIDADVLWHGHKHSRLNVSVEKLSCPQTGSSPIVREVRHIQTGAYFKTYVGQTQKSIKQHGRRTNYAADMGLAPQGKGGARVELHFKSHDKPYGVRVIQ